MNNVVRYGLLSTCDRQDAAFNAYFPRPLAIFNAYFPRPRLPEKPLTLISPELLRFKGCFRAFDAYFPRHLKSLTLISPGF